MKIVDVPTMRALDQAAVESGVPGHQLMARAGEGAFLEMVSFLERRLTPQHRSRFAVLAGKGNNGGDAYVVARLISERLRKPVTVYAVCPRTELNGNCRSHADALGNDVTVIVCETLPEDALNPGAVIVDGLLGTGVAGALRPPFNHLIGQVNAARLPVVALDIPSGLNGDTGAIATAAVVADLTVTMALPKKGMLTPAGLAHCGALRCVDIGIPAAAVAAAPGCGEALFARDAAALLGRRPHASHKGTFGHVLVVAGSSAYVGAPYLAALGALRSGTGLATVAVPETARRLAPPPKLALIARGLPDRGTGSFCAAAVPAFEPLAQAAQALVFGPGIGPSAKTLPMLQAVLRTPLPVVVDADGCRLLAAHPENAPRQPVTVVTPHPGEMRALLTGFGLDRFLDAPRVDQARALADTAGLYVVLKGMGTVIAHRDGRSCICTSGSSALATAGTGDVLAGILAGFFAQGMQAWDALRLGVFLHGYAAELAPAGTRALLADDLLELIGPALRELSPFP